MKKIIKVVPYCKNWPIIFESESRKIKKILKENLISIHHVGSTSVPGLCAKPVIDIFCIVKDLEKTVLILTKAGFTYKGELNLPLRLFFNRKVPNSLNLHVTTADNGEFDWQISFRNFLRENTEARNLYAKIKFDLINNNPCGFNINKNLFTEYTIKKGNIIRKISKMAGFKGIRFVIANNEYELYDFEKLIPKCYLDLDGKNKRKLCLYSGINCVCAALLKFSHERKIASIELINSIDDKYKNIMFNKIENWTRFHKLKLQD